MDFNLIPNYNCLPNIPNKNYLPSIYTKRVISIHVEVINLSISKYFFFPFFLNTWTFF